MDRSLQFVYLQTFTMLVSLVVLALINAATLTNFVAVSFVALLVVTEYTAPTALHLQWRDRLKWVLVGGSVIFAYATGQYLLAAGFRLGALSDLFG